MNIPSSPARNYRRLGYLAIAHALALLALVPLCFASRSIGEPGFWLLPLWVGLVTLWFFWPVVLALHHGRTALRLIVFLSIALVSLLPTLRLYAMEAPWTFGFPIGVTLNPISNWKYFTAHRAGRAEAKKDIASGILAIEESGLGAGGGPDVDILRERYNIEVRALAQCIVNETILGHQDGYNSVAGPEIDRRIGRDKVEAAREEGRQIAIAQREAAAQRDKDMARRLTTLPGESNLTLKSVSPYSAQHSTMPPDVERELGSFVQAVEQFIFPLVPKDSPAFELHISAALTRSGQPKFETSGSYSIPRSIYDPIYKEIPNLPVAQWTQDDLSVSLTFAKGEPR